jgi:hypothetical protein
VNTLARHLADAIAETAEEHLPKLDQTAFFHVKKALESTAEHIAKALHVDGCLEPGLCEAYQCACGNEFSPEKFLAACCIGKVK